MFDNFRTKLAKLHKSLTVWFNAALALVLANFPTVLDYVHQSMGELRNYLPFNAYQALGIFVLVVGVAIRMTTTKPLEEK